MPVGDGVPHPLLVGQTGINREWDRLFLPSKADFSYRDAQHVDLAFGRRLGVLPQLLRVAFDLGDRAEIDAALHARPPVDVDVLKWANPDSVDENERGFRVGA